MLSDYDLQKSTKLLESKLRTAPRSADTLYGLGVNLFFMNDFEGAARRFVEASKVNGDGNGYHQVWLGLSNLFFGMQVGQKMARFINNKGDPEY